MCYLYTFMDPYEVSCNIVLNIASILHLATPFLDQVGHLVY